MMNNPKVIEQARAAAARVLAETNQMSDRIVLAYRHSLSREPTAQESTLAQDYLEASISGNATEDEVRDAWARLIQTLWATPEFRYLR
jgi:cell division septum initiation protein DivIVA